MLALRRAARFVLLKLAFEWAPLLSLLLLDWEVLPNLLRVLIVALELDPEVVALALLSWQQLQLPDRLEVVVPVARLLRQPPGAAVGLVVVAADQSPSVVVVR